MNWLKCVAFAALALTLVACGPDLGELEKGETGKVAEIVDGDTLILNTGLRVTLTEIEAPYGQAPHAQQSRAALEQLALHRPVRLAYGGERRYRPRAAQAKQSPPPVGDEAAQQTTPQPDAPPTDERRDANEPSAPAAETALAHVYVRSEGGRWIWLQGAMVEQGFAYVRPRRQNQSRTPELLAAEARARAAQRGLWGEREYRVRTAQQMEREAAQLPAGCGRGPFRIVEGRIRSVALNERRAYLNFGEDVMTDFTIAIYGQDLEAWRSKGPDLETLEGKLVRARGRAAARGGPLLCLDDPAQLELLQERTP